MTDDEIVARADANYFEANAALAAAAPAGEVRARGGLLIVASGAPVAWLNMGLATRRLDDPAAAVREAIAYFDARELPFILRMREGVDGGFEEAAAYCGLTYSDTVQGMALLPPGPTAPVAAALEVRAVEGPAAFEQWMEVQCAGFDLAPELARQILSQRMLDIPDFRAYTGFVDGTPAAASALFMSHRTAGVYNVATPPAYRKRGFGEAMTAHAVREGFAAGCVVASLQASEMGRPLYERMGFRLVAPYRTFVRQEAGPA